MIKIAFPIFNNRTTISTRMLKKIFNSFTLFGLWLWINEEA